MCGIVGFTGAEPALPFLLDGLARLEYRGYDSAGVALQSPLGDSPEDHGGIWIKRRVGKLAELSAAVGDAPKGALVGIGHTRWATHGGPSEANAHPHSSTTGRVAVVHNGIIEDFMELRDQLARSGTQLRSETDSEVLAHLLEEELNAGADLASAMRTVIGRVTGSLAVAAMDASDPGLIVAARRFSPLVAGVTGDEAFLASDIPAVLSKTRDIVIIEDDQVAELRPGSLRITDLSGTEIAPVHRQITWDLAAAEKGGYPDFMLKEIHEQPDAVRDTLRGRTSADGRLVLDELRLPESALREVDKVFIVGCGTSFHAGMVAKYAIERWTRMACEIDIASEFRYRDPVVDSGTLVIGVSQSGETADTLAALSYARECGARTVAVVNVVDSSIARDADAVLYTHAGPEIGVAATKSHLAQVVALELLALYLAQLRGTLPAQEASFHVRELHEISGRVETVLQGSDLIREVSEQFTDTRDFFFLGRGVGYAVAMEGALKLKEISYARAEAYAAGEMKHGPIALIEPGTVVVAVATKSRVSAKTLSNVSEVRARGATVIMVASEGDSEAARLADHVLWVPETPELLSAAVDVVALQLFAYYLAKARGCDVDQPRNLAKTVTVE